MVIHYQYSFKDSSVDLVDELIVTTLFLNETV